VRLVVFVVFVVLALRVVAASGDAREHAPGWSVARVMQAIDGKRVPVAGRRVRIETDSTLCGGEGASARERGVRRWSRFDCTFTTFGARGIERDLEFRVRVVDARRLSITGVRWVVGS
jgi:hypothetical protein